MLIRSLYHYNDHRLFETLTSSETVQIPGLSTYLSKQMKDEKEIHDVNLDNCEN